MILLLAIVIAFLYYSLALYKKGKMQEYVSEKNLPLHIPKRSYFAFFVRSVSLVCAWVILAICLTRPSDNSPQEVSQAFQHSENGSGAGFLPKVDDVAFVLDVSSSMKAKDGSQGGERIARAKEIIESMVEELGGINVSLIAFAGNAVTVVPDTLDYLYFRILMESEGINDVGEAGTNLLAMVDTIKARYVDGPYHKDVRVILLTDGEDTGFLGMSDSAKKQAEITLIEHLAKTVSDRLQWEVIGLGTEAGAEVPDVTYEGKSVTSHMQRALLESLAQAGQGHFYAESEVPLTEICDDLLADVAGSRMDAQNQGKATEDLFAPRSSSVSQGLILAALLLIFASLALPQYERIA